MPYEVRTVNLRTIMQALEQELGDPPIKIHGIVIAFVDDKNELSLLYNVANISIASDLASQAIESVAQRLGLARGEY